MTNCQHYQTKLTSSDCEFLFPFWFKVIISGVCNLCLPASHQPLLCVPGGGWRIEVDSGTVLQPVVLVRPLFRIWVWVDSNWERFRRARKPLPVSHQTCWTGSRWNSKVELFLSPRFYQQHHQVSLQHFQPWLPSHQVRLISLASAVSENLVHFEFKICFGISLWVLDSE